MAKLLMISGDRMLAQGKHGAFYNTLEEFHKYWDQIDIICPPVARSSTKQLFGNVFIHSSPLSLALQPLWILKKGREIYRKEKFDLMAVHEFPPFYDGIGARWLWKKIRVPYILEIHHIPGHPMAGSVKEKFYKWLLGMYIKADSRRAKAVRVVNHHESPKFLTNHGVLKEKLVYIPSMYIDLNVFKPIEVEKKYDLVFAARLEKNKGILNLVEAIKFAKRSRPDIKLLIIGNGSEKQNLEVRIRELGLEENVVFSGWLDTSEDVAKAYNSARSLINPSYNEGGPRVLLEGMACGLSVITTPVGLAHDLIKNGQNGLITDWDPAKMASDILKLLEDIEMQKRFTSAGPELAQAFEKVVAIKNYAEQLKRLI